MKRLVPRLSLSICYRPTYLPTYLPAYLPTYTNTHTHTHTHRKTRGRGTNIIRKGMFSSISTQSLDINSHLQPFQQMQTSVSILFLHNGLIQVT